jgi:hypothetical protein
MSRTIASAALNLHLSHADCPLSDYILRRLGVADRTIPGVNDSSANSHRQARPQCFSQIILQVYFVWFQLQSQHLDFFKSILRSETS